MRCAHDSHRWLRDACRALRPCGTIVVGFHSERLLSRTDVTLIPAVFALDDNSIVLP